MRTSTATFFTLACLLLLPGRSLAKRRAVEKQGEVHRYRAMVELDRAARFLAAGHRRRASEVLLEISDAQRDLEWAYLMARAGVSVGLDALPSHVAWLPRAQLAELRQRLAAAPNLSEPSDDEVVETTSGPGRVVLEVFPSGGRSGGSIRAHLLESEVDVFTFSTGEYGQIERAILGEGGTVVAWKADRGSLIDPDGERALSGECVATLPDLVPLPEGSGAAWIADLRRDGARGVVLDLEDANSLHHLRLGDGPGRPRTVERVSDHPPRFDGEWVVGAPHRLTPEERRFIAAANDDLPKLFSGWVTAPGGPRALLEGRRGLELWDVDTAKRVGTVCCPREEAGEELEAYLGMNTLDAAQIGGGDRLVGWLGDKRDEARTLAIGTLAKGRPVVPLLDGSGDPIQGPEGAFFGQYFSLGASPSGHRVHAVHYFRGDMSVQVWDGGDGRLLLEEVEAAAPRAIAWEPEGRFVATQTYDEVLELRDGLPGEVLATFPEFQPSEDDLEVRRSPDGGRYLIGNLVLDARDLTRVFTLPTGTVVSEDWRVVATPVAPDLLEVSTLDFWWAWRRRNSDGLLLRDRVLLAEMLRRDSGRRRKGGR
jgi:hypothetical protein